MSHLLSNTEEKILWINNARSRRPLTFIIIIIYFLLLKGLYCKATCIFKLKSNI